MPSRDAEWTFLTNHAHVLLCIAQQPAARIQEIALRVGITYRGVQRILDELEAAGYLRRARSATDARANVYSIDGSKHLRHPIERHRQVAELLRLAQPERPKKAARAPKGKGSRGASS